MRERLKTEQGEGLTEGQAASSSPGWDHSTHEKFFEYYAEESASPEALKRFSDVRDAIMRVLRTQRRGDSVLEVADVGCGAGTQSRVWAEAGHTVHALDINAPLIELGRRRADAAGYKVDFQVGSATSLPWADESMDLCIALELLEHVTDWESCMKEFVRVLRPGGALFVTTTSSLCPVQAEFNLPLYSWYPGALKRHYEKLSLTTRPDLANFARYPAVHWFTFYGLRAWLAPLGLKCLDRFDIMDLESKSKFGQLLVSAARNVPVLRWLGHVCTPGTIILAIRS